MHNFVPGDASPNSTPSMSRLLPHFWAILFFIGISASWAYFSWGKGVEHIKQSDTTSLYYEVVNNYGYEREAMSSPQGGEWDWSSLLSQIWVDQRAVFASTDIDSLYHVSFERYFGTVYRVTGDVSLGYKFLVFPLNLVFMLGAYALFFHLTRKPVLSAFFAFMASFPIAIPVAGEYFGMGPVTIYSRRNFFTAFVPLVVYFYYRWFQRPGLLIGVFVFIGLISNLHASGILLAEILILAYLGYAPRSAGRWGYSAIFGAMVGIFGMVAMGGLWSNVESFFVGLLHMAIPSAHAAMSDFMQKTGIPEGLLFLFYPLRIYSHLPLLLQHAMALLVMVLSCSAFIFGSRMGGRARTVLLYFGALSALAYLGFSEFRYFLLAGIVAFALGWKQIWDSKSEITHYLILSTFIVSFMGMALFQVGYYAIDGFPLVFNQLRGSRFLGLMVFAWLAVLMAQIDWKASTDWKRRLLIFFVAISFVVMLRQEFRSYIRYRVEPDLIELLDVARWSKEHTTKNAQFLVVSTRFGIVAERRIFLHDRDSRASWGQNLVKRMNTGFPEINNLAHEKGMSYIVVKKDQVRLPADVHPVYENQRYALVKVDYPS